MSCICPLNYIGDCLSKIFSRKNNRFYYKSGSFCEIRRCIHCEILVTDTNYFFHASPCDPSPCQNNGICVEKYNEKKIPNGYICFCSPGFSGIYNRREIG
jgi:hypothetical protein